MPKTRHSLIINRQKMHNSGSIFYKSAFILIYRCKVRPRSFTADFPLFTENLFILPKNHNNLSW